MKSKSEALKLTPARFRSTVVKGANDARVDREGGVFGCGVIYGVSVNTVGEALGHELFCDQTFVQQTCDAINAKETGLKARFTHPGLSSDGVGTKLGKFFDARVEGDHVIADLHFQEASTKTPDGDLADYVMSLAEDTPEDFGTSIVFDYFEEDFVESDDEDQPYPHVRLNVLYACDVVDSPAANPRGLFKRGQDAAVEADAYLSYLLGLSDDRPAGGMFGVDPDRAKQFLSRFLGRHNILLSERVSEVSEKFEEVVETPEVSIDEVRADFKGELQRFIDAFGAERGAKWFAAGDSFADCQGKLIECLQAELKEVVAARDELQERLNSISLGEKEGVEFGSDEGGEEKPRSLSSRIRISGRKYE